MAFHFFSQVGQPRRAAPPALPECGVRLGRSLCAVQLARTAPCVSLLGAARGSEAARQAGGAATAVLRGTAQEKGALRLFGAAMRGPAAAARTLSLHHRGLSGRAGAGAGAPRPHARSGLRVAAALGDAQRTLHRTSTRPAAAASNSSNISNITNISNVNNRLLEAFGSPLCVPREGFLTAVGAGKDPPGLWERVAVAGGADCIQSTQVLML
ncbi:hypothetical protein T492DRAFT_54793 [Pavlovales sp. CCMP2436]|nr:hypothetical protein T492DRAFT_54793 [Pavlovales sp. CCMP2436]